MTYLGCQKYIIILTQDMTTENTLAVFDGTLFLYWENGGQTFLFTVPPSYFSQFIVDFNILTPYFYILRYHKSIEQSQMGIYFNIQTMESHFLLTKILVELFLIPWILRFMMVLGNVKFQTQTMTHIKSKWKPILLFMLLKKPVSSYLLDFVPIFYDFMTW